jgi:hypothetical protein
VANRVINFRETACGDLVVFTYSPSFPVGRDDFYHEGYCIPMYFLSLRGVPYRIAEEYYSILLEVLEPGNDITTEELWSDFL